MSVGMLTGCPAEEMPGSTGDARRRPGLVAIRLHTRRPWRACRKAKGSMAVLPIMEDIGLPSGRQGSLGNGEDTVHEG